MLRASHFAVSEYPSGKAFLDSLAGTRPDCVVLDFHMPGLTGADVQRAMLAARIKVPVIIITAHDQPAIRQQCLADGAIAYLAKPFRRANLLAAIDTALQEGSD